MLGTALSTAQDILLNEDVVMDFLYSVVAFFASGGLFMFPILLVFAVGVAISVERYITLAIVTNKNQAVWDKVQPLLANGEFDAARDMTSEDESTISQVLTWACRCKALLAAAKT